MRAPGLTAEREGAALRATFGAGLGVALEVACAVAFDVALDLLFDGIPLLLARPPPKPVVACKHKHLCMPEAILALSQGRCAHDTALRRGVLHRVGLDGGHRPALV